MDLGLKGKVALVTGAGSQIGFGRAIAVTLAAEGCDVVVNDVSLDGAKQTAAQVIALGRRASAIRADVASSAEVSEMVRAALAEFGQIDILVNNAGIGSGGGPFVQTEEAAWDRLIGINFKGVLNCSKAVLPQMLARGSGKIVSIASGLGKSGGPNTAVYSATKAAQIGFIEGLRAEFLGTGLHASVVYPVSTETEFHEALRRNFGRDVHPLGPRQSADEVARAIVECVVSPRAEVYPLRSAWWLSLLSVAAPAQADRVVQKWGRKVQR